MPENSIVESTPSPRTRATLAQDLRRLGVRPGMTLIVHSSLKSLGWVSGGPVTVVEALCDALTEEGTLVMPTQTLHLSDPAEWRNPPVPREWWQAIYDSMPVFHPEITPSYKMGVIVETFRTWPGTLRSNHPHVSFAACGRHARYLTERHERDYGLGEGSPLARLYELDGWTLLLGVGFDSCTALHLAEYRAAGGREIEMGCPLYENGQSIWGAYRDIDVNSSVFPEIASEFARSSEVLTGPVGSAPATLAPVKPLIDFATGWYTRKRGESASS